MLGWDAVRAACVAHFAPFDADAFPGMLVLDDGEGRASMACDHRYPRNTEGCFDVATYAVLRIHGVWMVEYASKRAFHTGIVPIETADDIARVLCLHYPIPLDAEDSHCALGLDTLIATVERHFAPWAALCPGLVWHEVGPSKVRVLGVWGRGVVMVLYPFRPAHKVDRHDRMGDYEEAIPASSAFAELAGGSCMRIRRLDELEALLKSCCRAPDDWGPVVQDFHRAKAAEIERVRRVALRDRLDAVSMDLFPTGPLLEWYRAGVQALAALAEGQDTDIVVHVAKQTARAALANVTNLETRDVLEPDVLV